MEWHKPSASRGGLEPPVIFPCVSDGGNVLRFESTNQNKPSSDEVYYKNQHKTEDRRMIQASNNKQVQMKPHGAKSSDANLISNKNAQKLRIGEVSRWNLKLIYSIKSISITNWECKLTCELDGDRRWIWNGLRENESERDVKRKLKIMKSNRMELNWILTGTDPWSCWLSIEVYLPDIIFLSFLLLLLLLRPFFFLLQPDLSLFLSVLSRAERSNYSLFLHITRVGSIYYDASNGPSPLSYFSIFVW